MYGSAMVVVDVIPTKWTEGTKGLCVQYLQESYIGTVGDVNYCRGVCKLSQYFREFRDFFFLVTVPGVCIWQSKRMRGALNVRFCFRTVGRGLEQERGCPHFHGFVVKLSEKWGEELVCTQCKDWRETCAVESVQLNQRFDTPPW